jgi:glycosyltransferase involved in cell wall biosynthesis
MSASISLITTCKGRLDHLRKSLPFMTIQSNAECIVVDYACPQGTADWVASNFPQVKIVRINDDPMFNQCRARNLGAIAAGTSLLCFVDADIMLSPEFASHVVPECTEKSFLRAWPVTMETWGTFVCRSEDFWRTAGYDEVYEGWGASPEDLYLRLAADGCLGKQFQGNLISSIPHSDEERTAHYTNKNRWWQHRVNSLYLIAKLDIMKLLRTPLSLEQRKGLYTLANQAIDSARSAGQNQANLEIDLEDNTTRTMNLIIRLDRKLCYSIRWPNSLG